MSARIIQSNTRNPTIDPPKIRGDSVQNQLQSTTPNIFKGRKMKVNIKEITITQPLKFIFNFISVYGLLP